MVSNKLKVGDIFKDGKRTYKVLEILPGIGYNARLIEEELPEEETKKEEELTMEMLEKMKLADLAALAAKMGLETKGKKAELIKRIAEAIK